MSDKIVNALNEIVKNYISEQKDFNKEKSNNIVFPPPQRKQWNPSDFRNMINPIRRNLDYQSVARRVFVVDNLKKTYNICG